MRVESEYTRGGTLAYFAAYDVHRAQVIGRCEPTTGIARQLRIVVDTVRKWRTRFCQQGLSGLRDRPRSMRPRVFGAAVVTEVKALACELPPRPRCRWRAGAARNWPARPSVARICKRVSPSTVRRWLAQDAIKPWQYRSWIFPRPPGTQSARGGSKKPYQPDVARKLRPDFRNLWISLSPGFLLWISASGRVAFAKMFASPQ
jgi:Homeodomain-like domain